MKTKAYLVLLIALLGLVACADEAPPVLPTAPAVTATAVAETETATTNVTSSFNAGVTVLADGVIKVARPLLPLSFETGGKLLSVHVQPGDVVAEGDLIATLDAATLQESISQAQLQLAQAENSLAQAQLDLDNLLNWQPDEMAIALAEANLLAAETTLANAQVSDAAAGNSLTSARVSVEQAERSLADAQDAYNTAFDPGREWELNDPWRADMLKAERDGATRAVEMAQEQLSVARANYALAAAGLNNDTAVSAEASVLNAQQTLAQAQRGPKPEEITAAELRVHQAELSLEQSQFSLTQAENALAKSQLLAPWSGVVLTVDVAAGALVGSGTPIVTLLDNTQLEFHTTNLSERDLGQIEIGQPALITLKAFANEPLPGRVTRVGLQAEGAVGDAATFPVIITLDETDFEIRPGMTGRAELQNGR